MAVMRDRPYGNACFLVGFGRQDAHAASAGFAEVIFPPFDAQEREGAQAPGRHLVLKRGLCGSLDLYQWWRKARTGKAPQRRTVTVELLAEDHHSVVMTWRFLNARPVTLSYSPLSALDGGAVIETLELAFDGVEMR